MRWIAASVLILAFQAQAESALRLPLADEFGLIPAATYDASGTRLGGGNVLIERLTNGNIRMTVSSDMGAAGRNVLTADMALVDGGKALQLLLEENHSEDVNGKPLGTITVDHAMGELRCAEKGRLESFPLPKEDRLAMIPGNLFLQPLLRGETKQIHFQIASCDGVAGFHFINVVGELAPTKPSHVGPDITKIDIHVDLGSVLNKIIVPLLPKVAFWFDTPSHLWLGHRIPTYTDGPTVILVREPTTAKTLLYGAATALLASPVAARE